MKESFFLLPNMNLETFEIKSKAAITLDAQSGSTVKPLLTYVPFTKLGYRLVNEYLEVNNLKAVSWIYSQPAVEFPIFELEDSESKQLLTAINLEWNSPRIQMDVVLNINNTGNWQRIASYSLLNSNPYPYREYDLGNHSLGNNSMIGLQIRNAGYGLLNNVATGQDKVTVFADILREVTVENLSNVGTKIANYISEYPNLIINANNNRRGLAIFNSSYDIVYFDITSDLNTSNYMFKLEPGEFYESPNPVYTGAYWAMVEVGEISIDIREFV